MHRRQFLALSAALALSPRLAAADAPLPVVASFTVLQDMVARVGGDRVAAATLVGRDGDPHVYSPSPADARAVAGARLLVVNGLGFEGWMERLIGASGFAGPVVVATAGIEPLPAPRGHDQDAHDAAEGEHDHDHAAEGGHDEHDHGEFDPHAWLSLRNAAAYVRTIAGALTEVDPQGAALYAANRDAYLAEIAALDAELTALVAPLPAARRVVVTQHAAFAYLGRDYGIRFLAAQGVSTAAEPSAADIAALIRQIRENAIPAVFLENVSDPRLLERIRAETGAAIGGTLYAGALSGPEGPAATYLDMMRHNVRTIAGALTA